MLARHPNDVELGAAGTAWCVALPEPRNPAETATLAQWFLILPYAHAFWNAYLLTLIHLRDIPGIKPAKKGHPDDEHELMLYVLSPEYHPRPENRLTWRALAPVNMVQQFGGLTDDQAIHLGALVAHGLVVGFLPAEPQGIVGAYDLWTSAIANTVEHVKAGTYEHPPDVPRRY